MIEAKKSHSIEFSGGVGHCSSKASRREDLEIEQPVACWDFASFHLHPTLVSMLGATLIRYQVVDSELTPCTVNALQIKAERCKGEVGISIARFFLCAPLWRERCT
jgi:hypothetical protein